MRDGRISSQEVEKLASPYGNGIDGHVVHAGTTPAVQRRLSVIELLRYRLHPKLFTPRRATTLEEVIRQLEERHRRRQASIDYAYRKKLYAELSKNEIFF